jgi:hypothetical protein
MQSNHPDQHIESMGAMADASHIDRHAVLMNPESPKLRCDQALVLDFQAFCRAPVVGTLAGGGLFGE